VFSGLWVSVALGEPEVDDVDNVLLFAVTDEEVVGLHVSVDEVVIMQEFKALDHLVCDHEGGLDCEFTFAVVEQIFQTWAQQVHHHCVVVALHAEPVDARDPSYLKLELRLFTYCLR
jgi:hypothetical protein